MNNFDNSIPLMPKSEIYQFNLYLYMKRNLYASIALTVAGFSMSAMLLAGPNALDGLRPSALLNKDGSVAQAQSEETEFGHRLLESWKRAGVDLPIPQEQIVRLKAGKKKLNTTPEVTLDPRIRFTGFLQYSNVGGKIRLPYGFYTFSQKDGLKRSLYKPLSACLNGGGVYIDNTLYGMSCVQFTENGLDLSQWGFYQWDTDTWAENGECGDMLFDLIVADADVDPVSGKAYGINSHGGLVELDYIGKTTKSIADLPLEFAAFAIANDGVGYGISKEGELYRINLSDGANSLVGKLDFQFYSALQSMAFDRKTGKCYFAASEGDFETEEMYGRLCEVNLTDATTKLVGYFPDSEEYTVLHVVYDPEPGAPGEVSDLNASYGSANGNANVTFTIPSTAFDGSKLVGEVAYSIYLNDSKIPLASGKAKPGEKVMETVTPAAGRSKFVVELSNDKGSGERYAIESWGGEDNPTVNDLKVVYDTDKYTATLSWANSNIGERGGFADMEGVTYSVFRFPGAEMVAEGLTDSSFSEDFSKVPNMTYYYNVVPVRNGRYFSGVKSDAFFGGISRDLPYSQDFENDDAYTDVWIIDANNDGKTWEVNTDWNGRGAMWNNCNAYLDSDDWVLFPAVNMRAGMTYVVRFNASAMSSSPERFEVKIGEGIEPASYTSLIPVTEVLETTAANGRDFRAIFSCNSDGAYHLGIHGVSPANRTAVVIDNVSIEEGYPLGSPDAPANIKVVPFEKGELGATIEFDAPTVAMDGTLLKSISKVTLYRGEEKDKVGELLNVEPGKHYSIVDEEAMNGRLLYTVVAANDKGEGQPASSSAYIGIDSPLAPVGLDVTDNLDGTFTLSWNAPTDSKNGGYVDPDELLYTIYQLKDGEPVAVAKEVEDTNYKVTTLPTKGNQAFNFFFVSAANDIAESMLVEFPTLISGTAYNVPFMEGFRDGDLQSIWRPQSENAKLFLYPGISTDNDGCVMGIRIDDMDASAVLSSGKISLKGVNEPKLAFTFYGYPGADTSLAVEISRNGKAHSTALDIDFRKLEGPEGFRTLLADLSPYKDSEYISLNFIIKVADCEACPLIVIDDVNVRDVPQSNLELTTVAPYKGVVGETANIDIRLFNVGLSEARGAKVDLFINDDLVKTVNMPAVAPFDRGNMIYPVEITPAMENMKVRTELKWDADMIERDNSATAEVAVSGKMLDAVDNLSVKEIDGKDMLSWTAPTVSSSVTDSFEAYNPFDYDGFGDWEVVDSDGMDAMPVLNVPYPGKNGAAAFFPIDFEALGYSASVIGEFTGHTGSSFVSCVRPSSLNNNDWLISPELSGNKQAISFWAKSVDALFGETISVLYSTNDKELDDFSQLSQFTLTNAYEEYKVELPAHARYFAIHCNSFYGGMLMMDDVTFEPKRTLLGYNVYCNGEKIAYVEAPVTEWSVASGDGKRVYSVSAVYAEGESSLSNKVDLSGIQDVSNGVSIVAVKGAVKINGAYGKKVTVNSLDGIRLFNAEGEDNLTIPLPSGIYVVSVDGKTSKLHVM